MIFNYFTVYVVDGFTSVLYVTVNLLSIMPSRFSDKPRWERLTESLSDNMLLTKRKPMVTFYSKNTSSFNKTQIY